MFALYRDDPRSPLLRRLELGWRKRAASKTGAEKSEAKGPKANEKNASAE
jgi:hypothetical protein